MKTIFNSVLFAALLALSACGADEDRKREATPEEAGHQEAGHEEEGPGNEVEISAERMSIAGIVVEPLVIRRLVAEIVAPGEVKLNAYLTQKVTPRIAAQVMLRHVLLGDQVKPGQPLITLSSVEMAEAQGTLQVAEQEWQRVRKLGRETVSDRRYTEAQVSREQAHSRAIAYGMTPGQVDALLAGEKEMRADGTFQLLAAQTGTVIRDDYVVGEFIEPGRVLIEISDESTIWVEASVTPEEARGIEAGATARIRVGENWLPGKVIQSHHILDEQTRTLAVRIELPNLDERLHPGLFVEARIQGGSAVEALAVPEEALLRSPDGDWEVFVEGKPGHFKSVEVELIGIVNGLAKIEGLTAGTRVVVEGAFFVQSEFAKSGFDVHAH